MHRVKSIIFTILALACTHAAPDPNMAHRLLVQDGGFTLHPRLGDLAGSGLFVVAAYPERTLRLERLPAEDEVRDYIAANATLLAREGHSVGGWCEEKQNAKKACFLDITLALSDRDQAVRLGKACNQISLAHLRTPEVALIETGGTGEALREGTASFESCRRLRETL